MDDEFDHVLNFFCAALIEKNVYNEHRNYVAIE